MNLRFCVCFDFGIWGILSKSLGGQKRFNVLFQGSPFKKGSFSGRISSHNTCEWFDFYRWLQWLSTIHITIFGEQEPLPETPHFRNSWHQVLRIWNAWKIAWESTGLFNMFNGWWYGMVGEVLVSHIFCLMFHHYLIGEFPFWTHMFQSGLVQPPTV